MPYLAITPRHRRAGTTWAWRSSPPDVVTTEAAINIYDLVGNAVKTLLPSEVVALYWTDSGSDTIKRCQPDGSGVTTLVATDLSVPRGIAVDAQNGRMYWIDSGNDTIKRANLDGSGVVTLVSTGLSTPRGLALDVASGHMYWTDSGNDTIKRASLDGTSVTTLVNTDLDSPEGIALDLAARRMYWTDSGATPRIKRANLDGTSAEPLVTTTSPAEIDLDTFDGHMYWIDSGTDTIKRANLDGSGATTLVSGLTTPRGLRLDLARRVMYFIDSGTDKLQRANLDGSSVTDLVTSGLTTPENLAVELPVRVTTHAYDAVNRRTSSTDALGGVSAAEYDAVGNVTKQLDARGFAHYFTYDPLNRRTHTKDPVHFAQTYTVYDAVGNVTRQLDPLGATTYMSYDRLNRASFVLDPAGALTYHTFDEVGNRTETHVLLGPGGERRSTYLQYDLVNRTTRRIAADGGATYFGHDLAGNQTLVVDPVGRPTYLTYDRLNRQETRKNAFLDTWYLVYDARSSVTRQIDPVGRTAYMSYDALRRLSSQSNALGETSSFVYDATGNRVRAQNPRGYSTYLRYDVLGRQTHTIDALGGVSYMGYDAVGNKVLGLDPLGNPTYMTYDGLSRTTHVKDALMAVSYMGYDSRSSGTLRVDADGRATYMAYDVVRRVERQHFANPVAGEAADSPIYYGYDQVGNLTSDKVLGGVGVSTFEHDKLDRVTKKVTLAGPVYYSYDLSGMRTSVKDPRLESTSYAFDAAGRRVRATVAGSPDRLNYFAYDASGLMTKQALSEDAVLTYYTYDVAGRLQRLENRDDSFGLLTYFAYNRDPNGAITHIRLAADENAYFVYDALDRLQWERRFFSGGSPSIDSYYLYDAASNRTSLTDLSVTTDYVYDARNLLVSSSDPLTNVNEFTYDASQRMTRRRAAALELGTSATSYFKHDQRDFPSSLKVLDQTGSTITDQSFHHNGPGERALVIGAQGGSTPIYFAHDGNRLLTERDENGFTYGRYRWGSLLESEDAESGTNEAPAVDERGNVNKLVGASGTAVYDRFGKEVSNTLASTTRTRFMPEVFTRMNISQKYSLTPSGLYLPNIAATTVGPGARIGRGLGQGGAPIDWGHDSPPIFGFVPLRGPWIPVPPIPTPLGEGKWVPPVRIAGGGGQGPTVWGQEEPPPGSTPPTGDTDGGDSDDPRDKVLGICGPDITALIRDHFNQWKRSGSLPPYAGGTIMDAFNTGPLEETARRNFDAIVAQIQTLPCARLDDVPCGGTVSFGGVCISAVHIYHILMMFYTAKLFGEDNARKGASLHEVNEPYVFVTDVLAGKWPKGSFLPTSSDTQSRADLCFNEVPFGLSRRLSAGRDLTVDDIRAQMGGRHRDCWQKWPFRDGAQAPYKYEFCVPCPVAVTATLALPPWRPELGWDPLDPKVGK